MQIVTRGRAAWMVDRMDDRVISLRPALTEAKAAAVKPPADLDEMFERFMSLNLDELIWSNHAALIGDLEQLPGVVHLRNCFRFGAYGPGISDDEVREVLRRARSAAPWPGGLTRFAPAVIYALMRSKERRPTLPAFIAAVALAKDLRPLTPENLIGRALERGAVMETLAGISDEIIRLTAGIPSDDTGFTPEESA